MEPILPGDIEQLVDANPDRPLKASGQTGRIFYVLSDDIMRTIIDDNTRFALQRGLNASASGHVDDWSVEDVKERGRKRLADND